MAITITLAELKRAQARPDGQALFRQLCGEQITFRSLPKLLEFTARGDVPMAWVRWILRRVINISSPAVFPSPAEEQAIAAEIVATRHYTPRLRALHAQLERLRTQRWVTHVWIKLHPHSAAAKKERQNVAV